MKNEAASLRLKPEEETALLAIARYTIEESLNPDGAKESQEKIQNSAGIDWSKKPCCGAFVTLHKKGALRGCIGRMNSDSIIPDTVREMALAAAFNDTRFRPLELSELSESKVEISLLSPFNLCKEPKTVEIGVHGLYLVHRGKSGVFLPQVAVEQGWNRAEYLDYICAKAGLPREAYKEKDAALYTFTALVFGEQ